MSCNQCGAEMVRFPVRTEPLSTAAWVDLDNIPPDFTFKTYEFCPNMVQQLHDSRIGADTQLGRALAELEARRNGDCSQEILIRSAKKVHDLSALFIFMLEYESQKFPFSAQDRERLYGYVAKMPDRGGRKWVVHGKE